MSDHENVTQAEKSVTTKRDTPRARAPSFGGDVTLSRCHESRDVTHGERDSDSTALRPTRHHHEVTLLALDPGPTQTGWCIFDGTRVVDAGIADNHDVLRWVKAGQSCDVLAIEMIANMGMAVGATTFDTVRWIGRFQQAWCFPDAVKLVFRREVKTCICGNQQAKDANIRQALIDLLGEPGTKKKPGPTYGVSGHAWSALAVAVTAMERMGIKVDPKQVQLDEASSGPMFFEDAPTRRELETPF